MRKLLACFDVVLADPDAVVIRDRGAGMSVTNNAEGVVDSLLAGGTLKPGMRLHYYDTQGELDELEFDASGFTGFSFDPPVKSVADKLLAMGLRVKGLALVVLVPWAVLLLGGGWK